MDKLGRLRKGDFVRVGEFVETCSLMPAVVMSVSEDGRSDIYIRKLDKDFIAYDNFGGTQFGLYTIPNWGIVRISAKQVLTRLNLGKDRLSEIWGACNGNYLKYREIVDGK